LGVAEQVLARDVVMVANLSAAHAAEKLFRPVRAGAVEAVRLLMIDALHFEAAVQRIPRAAFVGVDDGARLDAGLKAGVTYTELIVRMKKHGFAETEASITNKLKRGTFNATFFLAALAAIGAEVVKLEDI
jgi:hypothetical protein